MDLERYLSNFPDCQTVEKDTIRYIAWEKAWETRTFEIQMYWKRATYFWAFTASIFAGYITTASSNENNFPDKVYLQYILICLGVILAIAWILVNRGSKTWQQNWEEHIDRLEDSISGPLYKVYFDKGSFSVSKVNEIVSWVFLFIWLGLAFRFWVVEKLFSFEFNLIDPIYASTSIGVIVTVLMFFTYGRSGHSRKNKRSKSKNMRSRRQLIVPE